MNHRLLVLAVVFALVSHSSIAVATDSQLKSVDDKISDYRACLDAHVIIYGQANESVSDTIDAAFYACRNERAIIVLDIWNSRKEADEQASVAVGDEFVTNAIDTDFKEKAFVSLMESRVRAKNASNN